MVGTTAGFRVYMVGTTTGFRVMNTEALAPWPHHEIPRWHPHKHMSTYFTSR
jgi:hypothetical protein